MFKLNLVVLSFVWFLLLPSQGTAKDFYLTIGGGPAPSSNQASLENNVLFYQRLLTERQLEQSPHDIYFADGAGAGPDVMVVDRDSVPRANQLMAEFFGDQDDLGLSHRNHQVPGVRGDTGRRNIWQWFEGTGQRMQSGDRLMLYVTAHGTSSDDERHPYETSISLWNDEQISVSELVDLLDKLPDGIHVVTIMVQCHAGGFARILFNQADPNKGVSSQLRCGFFATVYDRPAAGCTPEIDEATYVEYSTYFWEAFAGQARSGQTIDPPDYDGDGVVSFDEAHAYTILMAHTIDLPIKTSGEFLRNNSDFGDGRSERLERDIAYEQIVKLATPAERAILAGLSEQLGLTGNNRCAAARDQAKERPRRRGRGRGRWTSPSEQLRRQIANDIRERWPELANVLNPVSVELLTTRSEEFVDAIQRHPKYERYREQVDNATEPTDSDKRRVKFERFVRTAENVILAENLRRLGDGEKLAQYQAIVCAEQSTMASARSTSHDRK